MSVANRIDELNRRHKALDTEIHEHEKRPFADATELRALKRKKLQLKEEIRELGENA